MSSFFTIPASQRKRKRTDIGQSKTPRDTRPSKSSQPKHPRRGESISGSESDKGGDEPPARSESPYASSESSSGHEDETGAERRLRLAERYLENVKSEVQAQGFDAEEVDRDLIAERLKEDVAESKGRLYRFIASSYDFGRATRTSFRGETGPVTAVAANLPFVYTASKDMRLVKWKLADPAPERRAETKRKARAKPNPQGPPPRRRPEQLVARRGDRRKASEQSYQGHIASILCLAASQDGKFVATGGRDKRLVVWSAADLTPLKVFHQHRDSINSLALQRGTGNRLYSASSDRTVKTWAMDELAYVETLFGHQDEVVDVAALSQERCLTAGARDRTVRLWKVVEETQLVFRGKSGGGGGGGDGSKRRDAGKDSTKGRKPKDAGQERFAEGTIDRVSLIDDETFITGSDNGSLCLWNVHKKKPAFELPLAHGMDPPPALEDSFAEKHLEGRKAVAPPRPRWITALKAVPYSDLVVSGSWDGCVRVWRVAEDRRSIEEVGAAGSEDLGVVGGEGDAEQGVDGSALATNKASVQDGASRVAAGVVNDLEILERGDKGRDGLCIVVALGKEHRLGKWKLDVGKDARNGAIVLEIPVKNKAQEKAHAMG